MRTTTVIDSELLEYLRNILGKEDININHNFFESGGNSLLAMQFIQMIKNNMGIKLPVKVIFEKPTIHELSILISQLKLMNQSS
ncbi:phosphopantetheine-binding protein [Solibacillus merdavium]|uniref:Acyl carrier protein n=1 Tax=Solibacillus merdavium TaxID=2762218 RepID=A0ABR8XM85_9BACL|nr:phosphopantetheine-binding protein [Solibacillus merdavium]MBD8033051.1 acyl carrier protein [Solibacillus merdavium]